MSSFITQRDTWTTARLDPGQARLPAACQLYGGGGGCGEGGSGRPLHHLLTSPVTVLRGPRVGAQTCERRTGDLHHGLERVRQKVQFPQSPNNGAYLTGIFMRSKWKNQENSMPKNTSWSKPEALDSFSKAPESQAHSLTVLSLPFTEEGDVFLSSVTGGVSSATPCIYVFVHFKSLEGKRKRYRKNLVLSIFLKPFSFGKNIQECCEQLLTFFVKTAFVLRLVLTASLLMTSLGSPRFIDINYSPWLAC